MTPKGAEDGFVFSAVRWLERNRPSAPIGEASTAYRDRRMKFAPIRSRRRGPPIVRTKRTEVAMNSEHPPRVWVGIDAGKESHWAHALDASGTGLISRRVENDEAALVALIDEVLSLSDELVWATDQPGGSAALLLALLWERNQRVIYVPGLTVDRARDAYRGESKTDARDAH